MKLQHFANAAGFAKGKEQIFAVETIIQPLPCGPRDQHVHGAHRGIGLAGVIGDTHNLRRHIRRQPDMAGQKHQHLAKATGQMVANGAIHLDFVFHKNRGNRPFGQMLRRILQKTVKAVEIHHHAPAKPPRQILLKRRALQGVATMV